MKYFPWLICLILLTSCVYTEDLYKPVKIIVGDNGYEKVIEGNCYDSYYGSSYYTVFCKENNQIKEYRFSKTRNLTIRKELNSLQHQQ